MGYKEKTHDVIFALRTHEFVVDAEIDLWSATSCLVCCQLVRSAAICPERAI
jgi:hypothetical protein